MHLWPYGSPRGLRLFLSQVPLYVAISGTLFLLQLCRRKLPPEPIAFQPQIQGFLTLKKYHFALGPP